MRIATLNQKQAIAPKKSPLELWDWTENHLGADIAIFTEAKMPKEGLPDGWKAVWRPDGIGEKRRWGTIVTAKGYDLVDVTNGVSGRGGFSVSHNWPGAVTIVDVMKGDKIVATVVGLYAITMDFEGISIGSGEFSVLQILDDLHDLMKSKRRKRLIVAGDFNLQPIRMPETLYRKMVDVVEESFGERELFGCTGCTHKTEPCGHMWTHKNGNSPGAKVQNLDYIFVSKKLRKKIQKVVGGVADFPDAWDMSDHAPVVVDLSL